jgi:hypothetical protein
MNTELIKELAEQAGISLSQKDYSYYWVESAEDIEKFAELIVRECVNTLEFHGFENAVPYIKWMATNKLGVEE